MGSSRVVEAVNNTLVLAVLASFLVLVSSQLQSGIDISQLGLNSLYQQDLQDLGKALPVMFVALVYHNVVPSICSSLSFEKKQISLALIVGTLIPLFMFVLWIGVALSSGQANMFVRSHSPGEKIIVYNAKFIS